MSQKELWEKLEKLPGGDKSPFDIQLGPTKECLTSNQVVAFVKSGETDDIINNHIKNCDSCRRRVEAVRSYEAGRDK